MKRGCLIMYLHNDKEQFVEALNLTAYSTAIMVQAIEKDYYVSMILRLLSSKLPFIVFKGGTSLQKCYGVIKRFSEDIDLTIDIILSQGQKKKVKEAIVEVAELLGMRIDNIEDTQSRRDYNKYIITYDTVLPLVSDVLQPAVLLETSYTAVSFPAVSLPVNNYIGEMMKIEAPDRIEYYNLESFNMKVQELNRTLADKVFAICDYYLQGKIKKHSRHLYDIYRLYPIVAQTEDFKALVNDVRNERSKSAVCPSAKANIDIPTILKKIILEESYKADYERITMSLLGENIGYDEVISTLKQIAESDIY